MAQLERNVSTRMVFLTVTLTFPAPGHLYMLFPMLSMFCLHSLSDGLSLILRPQLKKNFLNEVFPNHFVRT